ncbi:hypothetical protein J7M00_05730 [bacterium]|nr:hypothetical protein [bacterium]
MPIPPYIEAGKATSSAKGWASVKFKKPFAEKPVVVAFMESTEGWFAPPKFWIPKASATYTSVFAKTVQKIDDIPRIQRPDMRSIVARDFQNKFKDICGDWGLLNWLRDKFSLIFYGIGYVAGAAMNYMWDRMIQPQLDKVRDSINEALGNVESAINSAISNLVGKINTSLESVVRSTNGSIDEIAEALSEATEKAILEWYEAMGLEKGQLPQFALVRNVSKDGFEVWIPRPFATVYYIAVGVR